MKRVIFLRAQKMRVSVRRRVCANQKMRCAIFSSISDVATLYPSAKSSGGAITIAAVILLRTEVSGQCKIYRQRAEKVYCHANLLCTYHIHTLLLDGVETSIACPALGSRRDSVRVPTTSRPMQCVVVMRKNLRMHEVEDHLLCVDPRRRISESFIRARENLCADDFIVYIYIYIYDFVWSFYSVIAEFKNC